MTRDEIRSCTTAATPDEPKVPSYWTTDSCFPIPLLGKTSVLLEIFKEEFNIESSIDSIYNLMQIPLSDRERLESHIVKDYLQSIEDCWFLNSSQAVLLIKV